MTDAELSAYIPIRGDRLAVRNFCEGQSDHIQGKPKVTAASEMRRDRKKAIIDRLRRKLELHGDGQDEVDATHDRKNMQV